MAGNPGAERFTMESGMSGIDHAILAVPDLDLARMAWTRLGFTLSPRGRHLGLATGNYCILFEHDYLELLGIVEPGGEVGQLARFLGPPGLTGLAWGTVDAEATKSALARRGLDVPAPADFSRQIELEDESVLLRFRMFPLPEHAVPSVPSIVFQHLTPEILRRPVWMQHKNAVTGITGATVVVDDTAPLVAAHEKFFGPGNVTLTDRVLTVRCGRHSLTFVSPEDFATLYPEIEPPRRNTPFLAALRLETADAAATEEYLVEWQIGFIGLGEGTLVIPPEEADGTVLEIVPHVEPAASPSRSYRKG